MKNTIKNNLHVVRSWGKSHEYGIPRFEEAITILGTR